MNARRMLREVAGLLKTTRRRLRAAMFGLAFDPSNGDNIKAMMSLWEAPCGMAVRPGVLNPEVVTHEDTAHEEPYSVYLHDDSVNAMEYVVNSLIDVFGHPRSVATQIMVEAHFRGMALAEVESKDNALKHNRQLGNLGLTSSVERMQ